MSDIAHENLLRNKLGKGFRIGRKGSGFREGNIHKDIVCKSGGNAQQEIKFPSGFREIDFVPATLCYVSRNNSTGGNAIFIGDDVYGGTPCANIYHLQPLLDRFPCLLLNSRSIPPILFRVKKYHSMAGQISATSFIRMSRVSSSIIVANSSISSLYRLMRQVNIIVRRGYSYYSL